MHVLPELQRDSVDERDIGVQIGTVPFNGLLARWDSPCNKKAKTQWDIR